MEPSPSREAANCAANLRTSQHFMETEGLLPLKLLKQPHSLRPVWSSYIYILCLIQQQEDQINTQDNLPSTEEATEREPCGLRII
jgi:hypothetical protein